MLLVHQGRIQGGYTDLMIYMVNNLQSWKFTDFNIHRLEIQRLENSYTWQNKDLKIHRLKIHITDYKLTDLKIYRL